MSGGDWGYMDRIGPLILGATLSLVVAVPAIGSVASAGSCNNGICADVDVYCWEDPYDNTGCDAYGAHSITLPTQDAAVAVDAQGTLGFDGGVIDLVL